MCYNTMVLQLFSVQLSVITTSKMSSCSTASSMMTKARSCVTVFDLGPPLKGQQGQRMMLGVLVTVSLGAAGAQ